MWVNGRAREPMEAAIPRFLFDITYLAEERNTLLVKAVDTLACDRPRGKQSWKGEEFRSLVYADNRNLAKRMADLYIAVVSDGGKNHSNLDALTAEVEVEAKKRSEYGSKAESPL